MDKSFECVSEKENGGGGIGAGDDCPVMLLEMSKEEQVTPPTVLPTPASTVLPKKRGRPRKSTSDLSAGNKNNSNNRGSNDNPYQFYYYSGFGPSWSKRRGETKFNSVPQLDNCNIMDDDDNKDNNNGHEIESFKSVIDAQWELDYIEDGEDEEEWYGGGRVRKPIKARSLKSLM